MGISTHAYQIAIKVVKDLTESERRDWLRDFQMVVKVLGGRQKELFPEEALRAEKRAQRQKEKAAGKPRDKGELDAQTDANRRSDPNAGGAQVDIEEAIKNVTEREKQEGAALLEGKSDAWRTGFNAFVAGGELGSNPYVEGSADAREWIAGFNASSEHAFNQAAPETPESDTPPTPPADPKMQNGETFNQGAGKPKPKSQSAKAAEKAKAAGLH